jgi:cation/acetate symporter
MSYQPSPWAIVIFFAFVASVLLISKYFASRTKSAEGYFAAGGNIPWSVNGIAFAGDYLSAASFLGICGLISLYGYDGFLYSIGYLAGWVVALFIVAEPMKRLGKFTFTDAIDSKFNSKGIQLMAAISTLIVSMFYLIPQMVGAGSLVTPLLGWPQWAGVVMVGVIVIIIVATAGMASTTYVQFLKGALLIVFSVVLVILILGKGLSTDKLETIAVASVSGSEITLDDDSYFVEKVLEDEHMFVLLSKDGEKTMWKLSDDEKMLETTLFVTKLANGKELFNGSPKEDARFRQVGHLSEINGDTSVENTGKLGPISFIQTIKESTVVRWKSEVLKDGQDKHTIYYQTQTPGKDVLSTGLKYKLDSEKGATAKNKLNFISLMLALFCGTAALPHVLIRYYTVPSPAAARKSTIVAILAIGFFYILTLYIGLGAMTGGVIDLTSSNMAAPLLAKTFGVAIFAIISAIAFATVLGTVSGLIVASSGAVAHDIVDRFMGTKLTDKKKVWIGKIAALGVGAIAIVLGILFKGMNVSYLVGWAFAVAASANLPAIFMLLFWKKTTSKGIVASILVGLVSAMAIILLSQTTFDNVYHLVNVKAPMPIDNPAIISVPLSFITIVVVSLFTQKKKTDSEQIAE